jgi:phosphate butyryltransferase
MPFPTLEQLHGAADAQAAPIPVSVAGAADRSVLEALQSARERGWVAPILVGSKDAIRAMAADRGLERNAWEIVHADSADVGRVAVDLVRAGRAAMLMKGQVATPDLLRAMLDHESGLRTTRIVCQVVLMELPRDGRRLLLADTGICVRPTLEQKADIVRSVVEVAHALGEPVPRVALVAASERAGEAMPETLDAAALERLGESGEFPSCHVQGPLSFDLAYATDAGEAKHLSGPVIGAADALVFPDLLSANLTVKAIMYTADCRFGGVLHGARCPVAFMSRADTPATRLNSLALALAMLRHSPDGPAPRP